MIGLPDDASVLFSKKSILGWLGRTELPEHPDLGVKELAALFHKSPHVIRVWLRDRDLVGYKMAGEWRVTSEEAVSFRNRMMAGQANGITMGVDSM